MYYFRLQNVHFLLVISIIASVVVKKIRVAKRIKKFSVKY